MVWKTSGVWVRSKQSERSSGVGVGVSERRQGKSLLDEVQDAAEIVVDVRNVALPWRKARNHDQRNAEAVDVA
jgi:hypothetical protein